MYVADRLGVRVDFVFLLLDIIQMLNNDTSGIISLSYLGS
jgi:hypothetical protein